MILFGAPCRGIRPAIPRAFAILERSVDTTMPETIAAPPLVAFVGWSDAGKTTFIEKLIPALVKSGLRVGTIKHDRHGFEMDRPGKDSWRHKQAGAVTTLVSSPVRIGMVQDVDHDYSLDELLPFFRNVDLVLAEGYKHEAKNKIEVFRPPSPDSKPLCVNDSRLIALVSDLPMDLGVPRFGLEDAGAMAQFLAAFFDLSP